MRAASVTISCVALSLACEGKEEAVDEAYLDGVPEQAAIQLQITGDPDEGLATESEAVAAEIGAVLAAQDTEGADGLRGARQGVRELNETLRNFLQPIVAMVRNTTPEEIQRNVAQWGPVTRGETEYRFFVRKGVVKRFGWVLQARPDGSDADYVNVAAGSIAVGSVARRGIGNVGVDLDAFGEVDPTVAARGQILASFAHGPRGTVLAYGLRNFTRTEDDTTPIDAAFQGVHLTGGYNRVRLAFHGNLPESATEAEELVLARVRHRRGEGGRADLLVTGGDVADGRVWVVSECWDRDEQAAFRAVIDCPGDGPGGDQCEVVSTSGAPSACLGELRQAELPPLDPEEHMDDAESPDADLLPPDAMPDGTAE